MIRLSASKLKTAFSCSWLYYAKYILKVPDESNSGAARGSVSHEILEQLIRHDRQPLVEQIKKNGNPFSIPSVNRLGRLLAKKYGVWNPDDFKLIQNFVLVALKLDFYMEGAEKVEIEQEFNLSGENWHAIGYIDKMGIYPDKIKIVDYKTSKAKFSKDDLNFNLQNYLYTLAAKKRYPNLPVQLEFQFLKMGRSPSQVAPVISDDELAGFEIWLEEAGKYLNNFNYQHAVENPAKSNFKNSWMCGKPAGTIKDTGEIAFSCNFRMPFFFYELMDGEKVVSSSKNLADLEKIQKPDQKIIQKTYEGCPFFKHEWS